jgi:hypothetical protein
MCAGQIAHMSVIAHARAITGGIIVDKNFEQRAVSGGDL